MACAAPIGLALLSGCLYTLSLPNFDFAILGWIALVPLHVAVRRLTLRRTFWIGWLGGTTAFVGSMSWVITAMHLYGKVPVAVSVLLMLLLSAYLGLYVALYALGFRFLILRFSPHPSRLTSHGSLPVLAAPFLWVALEWVRTYLLSGLPWSLLGYSQYRWLPVIQIADFAAVYGVSFLLAAVNVALADVGLWAWDRYRSLQFEVRGSKLPPGSSGFPVALVATTLALLAGSLLYGFDRLSTYRELAAEETAKGHVLHVGLVQANIDQSIKWDERYRRATQDRYTQLTKVAAIGADLVIWPEAATPFLFELEQGFREEISSLLSSTGVPLLFGSPTLGYYPNRRPYLMNSAYLLSTEGQILGRYGKRHLVPFGEYIPFHNSLLYFLDKLVEGIGDFKAGTDATILTVPDSKSSRSSPLTPHSSPVRFGVVICYEVIFPNEVRDFAANGADFMITITNDAWFGRSSAPYQHFAMVALRAVENRVAFARAANTGISGFIDQTGRILDATPIFTEATVMRALPVFRIPTFYTGHGDVFAHACVIIAGIFVIAGTRHRAARERKRAGGAGH
jgi:apolipoprotein N-acyltransferase